MFEALIPRFPDYELIDSGDFEKLERFGRYVVRRPEPQAIWRRSLTEQEWRRLADASFLRDGRSEERGEWRLRSGMPSRWTVDYAYEGMRLRMRLGLTSFKHVGLFPEQAANWNFIYDNCVRMRAEERTPKVLNLFAYTGGATLAARAAGSRYDPRGFGQTGRDLGAGEYGAERFGGGALDRRRRAQIRAARSAAR